MGEQVRCAMEVGASTLGVTVRVYMTFGCAMVDATLGDVGCTLGALGGLYGNVAEEEGGLWMGEVVGLPVCRVATGVECFLARMQQYGGVEK